MRINMADKDDKWKKATENAEEEVEKILSTEEDEGGDAEELHACGE